MHILLPKMYGRDWFIQNLEQHPEDQHSIPCHDVVAGLRKHEPEAQHRWLVSPQRTTHSKHDSATPQHSW